MEFQLKKPLECISVDMDSMPGEIEKELLYWESQYEWACEISDAEGRKEIIKVMNLLEMWMSG